MKVIINRCYGGFSLSRQVYESMGWEWDTYGFGPSDMYMGEPEFRTIPELVEVVERLGSEASSGSCAELHVVEIPDDVDWYIDEYDGWETIRERHRTW